MDERNARPEEGLAELIQSRAEPGYAMACCWPTGKAGLSKLNRKLLLLLPGRVESELVTPFNRTLIISQNPVKFMSKQTLCIMPFQETTICLIDSRWGGAEHYNWQSRHQTLSP